MDAVGIVPPENAAIYTRQGSVKMKTGLKIYSQDRFQITFTDKTGRIFRQGKRVSADCKILYNERREYVKNGSVKAVKLIMQRGLSLAEAWQLLKKEREYTKYLKR